MNNSYDVIVVGAGHAGLEAAFACAHLQKSVGLFSLSIDSVAQIPCNPSIGGPAKGIVTREIDALGGMQARATDACSLQIKMLNTSKGPGVRALRAQIDKIKYHDFFISELKKEKLIDLLIDEVCDLIIEKNKIVGIKTSTNIVRCKKLIITTGTYMQSIVHIGDIKKKEGPLHSPRSDNLSLNLKRIGFKLIRLKTGTPPRIDINSFDRSKTIIQTGTNEKLHFSHYSNFFIPFNKQILCYLTRTNKKTHEIIRKNLKKSAMYSGSIKGVGPRYCPSIEDKIVRFKDKSSHQIFIEPVSKSLNIAYLQGLSSSLPKDVQDLFIHSISGLENSKIIEYAYAIEYDAINPMQLYLTLESKLINGLYFAGQVNGTSGYEEAAGQGLIAGINASLSIAKKKPLILQRNQSYIGVMIDDLVTKGITEPYRLLTSRAEYRLYLRNDNADDRLMKIGYEIGLINDIQYKKFINARKSVNDVINFLKKTTLKGLKLFNKKYHSHSLYELLKQPNIDINDLITNTDFINLHDEIKNKIQILVKFDGYIKHSQTVLKKFNKNLLFSLKCIDDYNKIKNLSLEAREKLNQVHPLTLDQASRIPGITINDLMVIKYYVQTNE